MNMTNKGVFTALMHMIAHLCRIVNPVFANFDALFSLFLLRQATIPRYVLHTEPHDSTNRTSTPCFQALLRALQLPTSDFRL